MKNRLLISLLMVLAVSSASAYEVRDLLQKKASIGQVKSALHERSSWIKYPAYANRNGWDALTGLDKASLISKGESYLGYEWKVVAATNYLAFERNGSRVAMEAPFNANSTAFVSLLMAELAEGKGRFMDQIVNGVWQYCDISSWVLSAHQVVQKSKRALPDFREEIIDLTSGDLGSLLSWTYYFLKPQMDKTDPVVALRLRKALQDRILDPYMTRSDLWWQAFNAGPTTMVNNWNPWCNFNMLTCFLLLEDDPDKLATAVHRTMASVDKFINYNHEDGACEEGPSYWGHAAGKMYDYLQLLSYATGGSISIFNETIIKNMGEYIARSYVGNGWVVNFADASAKGGGDPELINRYGKAVGSGEMMGFAAYLLAQNGGKSNVNVGRDIFRAMESMKGKDDFLPSSQASLPNNAFAWYPQTQFCYMRSKTGFFFAAKGGYNAESHNHNDAGTFSLYLDAVPMFIDAGVGTYTRQTFSSERYSIWTMQSNYHNLPMINGKPQMFGRQYKAKDVIFNPAKNTFSLDISGAYAADASVNKWQRLYTLNDAKGLTITDLFELKETTAPNQVNFLTWSKPDLSKAGEVTLQKDGKSVTMTYDSKLFDPSIETIQQTDTRLSRVWGSEIYRLTLTAKKMQASGKYSFTIQRKD